MLDHESGVTSIVDVSYAAKLSKEPFPETLIELDGNEGTMRLTQSCQLEITNAQGTRWFDVSPKLLS